MFANFRAGRSVAEMLTCCVIKAREAEMAPLSDWFSFSLFCPLPDLLHHLLLLDLWPQLLQSWHL